MSNSPLSTETDTTQTRMLSGCAPPIQVIWENPDLVRSNEQTSLEAKKPKRSYAEFREQVFANHSKKCYLTGRTDCEFSFVQLDSVRGSLVDNYVPICKEYNKWFLEQKKEHKFKAKPSIEFCLKKYNCETADQLVKYM